MNTGTTPCKMKCEILGLKTRTYENGKYKRCMICSKFFLSSNTGKCPCCNNRMRNKPRVKRFRDKFDGDKFRY